MINYTPPIGQEKVISYFENTKTNKRLGAAYVLEGKCGIGKKEIVKYLSLLVMCDENKPCLNCEKCRYTVMGTNPDIITVTKEDKASIGVERVREIIEEAYIMPSVCSKKIFIIDEAHLLTTGAQNALLKVLEEPPEYVMFFLLCENTSFLLQTILSRSVTVKLNALSKEDLIKITHCKDDFLVGYAQGNAGKLIKLMHDEKFKELRNSFFDKMNLFLSNNAYDIYKIYDFFDENKESKDTLWEMLVTFFRDVLFYKNLCENFVINKDKMAYIASFSNKLTKKKCENICNIAAKSQIEMGKYGGYAVNIHAMLIKIWEEIYG